jgi:DNA repair exonuclease SbcCD ATPase subunit
MSQINPTKIDVRFTELKKIIQISDLHIRLFKRHVEYREAFATLYEGLFLKGSMFEDSIILFTGDLLHAKTDLSPEMVALASEFLRKLADISPTFVVVGNHDLNLANKFRLDSLSPIIENISHPDLYYLRNSGIYQIADTDLAVFSILEDRAEWPSVNACSSPNTIAVCHAPVNNAKTDTGFEITNRHLDVSVFDDFDMALLGDIHRHQILQKYDPQKKKPIIAYAGSMIQQNHGESLSGHGWLEWDVPSRTFEFHELKNKYGYATLVVENGKMPDLSEIPPKVRLRVFVKDMEPSKVKKIQSILRSKFQLCEFTINKLRDAEFMVANKKHATDLIDVHDLEIQNKLMEDFLTTHHAMVDDIMMDRIQEINKQLNARVHAEDLSRNIQWKPLLFEFSNMFSYGEDNVIDFESLTGVHGLFSPNASGKTAAFDALMFCLFDKTPRAFKASHIMNNRKNKFESFLKFEINGVEYGICRVGQRKKNLDVKVDVDFWRVENGKKVSLNAEDRRSTNAAIRRYVGNYDDFILTSLSLQTNNALFIDKSQSERKDLLSQFMGVNIFDALYNFANDEMKEAAGALKMLNKEDFAKTLASAQASIDTLQQEYTFAEASLQEKEETLQKLDKVVDGLYESKVPLDITVTNIDSLEVTKSNLATKLNELSEYKISFTKKSETLISNSGSLVETLTCYNEAQVVQRYSEVKDLQNELKLVKNEINNLDNKITSDEKQLAHMTTHKFDPACEFCVRNNQTLVASAKLIREELDQLKNKRRELGAELEHIRKSLVDFEGIEVEYQDFISSDKQLQQIDRQLLVAQAKISEINSALSRKKAKLVEISGQIKKYYESVDLIEKNAAIDLEIASKEQERKELVSEINVLETRLRGIHGKLQVQKTNKGKILRQIGEMEELEQTISAYKYYIDAVRRDGIPYELISKIIPSIESEINNILTQIVDFTVTLEVDGKNINGRIVYDDERHWPLEMSSGMERFISSLAIRVALINVSNLPKPNFLIIDEGLGVLSSENLMSMNMLFSILKSQFEFMIIISHLEAVRDMVDSLMEIQIDNGYSKINY